MSAIATLTHMKEQLQACQQGTLSVTELTAAWRSKADQLELPPRFGEVLDHVLDRLESGALFSEESCSFSQRDLLASLQVWADKAQAQLVQDSTMKNGEHEWPAASDLAAP